MPSHASKNEADGDFTCTGTPPHTHKIMEVDYRMCPQMKECQQPLEAERDRELPSDISGENMTLLIS